MAEARSPWLEVEIERAGADLRITARGSRDERPAPHLISEDVPLASFAAGARTAASRGRPLGVRVTEAKEIHEALFRDGLETLRARLAEAAAGAPLLVRFLIRDPELQAFPWEALCNPESAMGFLGTSPDLLPVRGVTTSDPWQPGAVHGALRVLAIAPQGGRAAGMLRTALAERIASGEIEWLEPLEGQAAEVRSLFQRLRREPAPHVIHFLGHGGALDGVPALRLADSDDEESWLPVELLAQQLKASFGHLRLIVLEACEGARPSAFASAAEILARAGADAVVAHLWPVQADVARLCSEQIYRTLAGAGRSRGDIALSLNEARRAVLGAFGGSAEAFSPVVYLRGSSGVLFDFTGRLLGAGAASPPEPRKSGEMRKPGAVPPATLAGIRKIPPPTASSPSLKPGAVAPAAVAEIRKVAPRPVEIEPAPLSRTPLPLARGENRICTVMIVDLSSSAMSTRLDPGEVKDILDSCLVKVAEQINGLGGNADRLGPDSLIGVFGARQASEIDPERAVHAALRVQSALLKVPLPRSARALRPTARIGISTGRVFAELSEGLRLTVVGDAVSVAVKLQQTAPPGAILIGRDTGRLVSARFQLETAAAVEVAGHKDPVAAYKVIGPMPFRHGIPRAHFYELETKLAGRQTEMRRLTEALDDVVAERRACLVTIVGPPGAGRSRMLAELYSSIFAHEDQFLVNVAEGSALSLSTSYGVAASLLRRRFDIQESEAPQRIHQLLRRGVRWLRLRTSRAMSLDAELASVDLTPDLDLLSRPLLSSSADGDLGDALLQLAGVLDAHTDLPSAGDAMQADEKGAQTRHRIAAAAADLLRFAAARRPVMILCDDVHWADDATLDLLDEMVLRLDDLPVLIVCTARPELYERRPHWGEGKPAHRRIDLGLLDRRSVEEMIRDRLRNVRDLSVDFVRVLVERADGNPLILDETMRLLVEAGVIEVGDSGAHTVHETQLGTLALPTTIQGLIQARLDRLDPKVRAVLERAAVVGKTFWEGAVDQLRQGGGPAISEILKILRDRQLIRARDATTFPGEREYVFTESATQEVAYEMIPARVRRPMHRRVAKWLKARAPGSAEAALIALHYDRAEDPLGAAEQLARAAAYAISLGQNTEAHRFLVRLRELHEEADNQDPANFSRSAAFISWRDRVRLRLDFGDVLRRMGKLDEAESAYGEARASIIQGDPDAARWEARTDFRLALLLKMRGNAAAAGAIAERAIARAQKAGIAEETPAMYGLLAVLYRRERRHEESHRASLLGLRACRIPGAKPERRRESATEALLGLAPVLYQRGRYIAAERTYLQAGRLAEKAGNLEPLGRALNGVAASRAAQGQHARARATYLQSLRVKEKAGDLYQIAIAYSNVAELEIEMNDLRSALAHARRGLHLAEQIRAESDLAEMYRILGEAALRLGEVDEAIDACLRAFEIAKRVGTLYLDDVVLTLARACVRITEIAPAGSPLHAKVRDAYGAMKSMLAQGTIDGELRQRVELSLALVGEYLT